MNQLAAGAMIAFLSLGFAFGATAASAEQEGKPVRRQTLDLPHAQAPAPAVNMAEVPVWKRITIGTYTGVNALRGALLAAGVRVGDSADEILGRPAFHFSNAKTELDIVAVSVAELGFDGSTTLAEIYRRAGERGLELCPAEAGPMLRLQYANQPVGEFLDVAMRPIATYGGDLIILSIANGGTGPLLVGTDGRPDFALNRMAKLVFVRPARIAVPNMR
jgi:hypothetical protein